MTAIDPANRHLSSKMRAFVEWAGSLFEDCVDSRIDLIHRGRHAIPHFADAPSVYVPDPHLTTHVAQQDG